MAIIGLQGDSEHVLKWTQQRAQSLAVAWIVASVQSGSALSAEEQADLTARLAKARELGAEIITATPSDLVNGIRRIAEQRGIGEIIVGAVANETWWRTLRRDLFLRRLLRASPGSILHVMPGRGAKRKTGAVKRTSLATSTFPQYAMALGVVAAVTLAAFVFTPVIGAHATALVFLFTVVLLALVAERGPTLAAAALSALSWDFFFLPPVFAFRIQHFEDAMLFAMYFIVALALGQLTGRIRAQEGAERRRQELATALFLLTRELSQASNPDELAAAIVRQVEHAFRTAAALLFPNGADAFKIHPASSLELTAQDRDAVCWVFHHGKPAGKFTEYHLEAKSMFVPLSGTGSPVAVLGLHLTEPGGLSASQHDLLSNFAHQIALVLERNRINQISEKAKLLAESERLSKTLLDSMSHEMRTPLAAIRSATGNLLQMVAEPLPPDQREMLSEIEEATDRLDRLVGKVLEVSRLESGSFRPRFNECDVSELVHVAVADMEKQLAGHHLKVQLASNLPLVRMDFVLMQQVLTNLLSNAAFHTPRGSHIELRADVVGLDLLLQVSDDGPGIPRQSLDRIFDKFYRAPNAPTGGTGLGLSLVKGFVEANGGKIEAENQPSGGASFTIRLPVSSQENTGT